MIAVILAGGYGSRMAEETTIRPKPMVEIGGKPILWHIMKGFSHQGIHDFIVCCGYKGWLIKEYFANYFLHNADVTFSLAENRLDIHNYDAEQWRVTLVETGTDTMTGGRLKRVRSYIRDDLFYFTYGDGVANINLNRLLKTHLRCGRLVTVTAVRQPSKYGVLSIKNSLAVGFEEKSQLGGSWVNGGFFVVSKSVLDLIEGDHTSWEYDLLPGLVTQKQLSVYRHRGFWQAMDTLRDRMMLEDLWARKKAPWKIW